METTKANILKMLIAFGLLSLNCAAQAPVVGNGTGAGNCLNFNGTSNYVDVPDNTNWNLGNADFSISLWVNLQNITDNSQGFLLHAVDGNSGSNGWAFLWNAGDGINFYTGTSGGMDGIFGTGTWTPSLNTWIHLAVIRSGNNWTIYQNGAQIRTATAAVTIGNGNCSLKFAKGITYSAANAWNSSSAFYATALLDEVRIWNRALTQAEIRDTMCKKLKGTETGLTGYWRMDEGTGTTTTDATVNNNTGTLH